MKINNGGQFMRRFKVYSANRAYWQCHVVTAPHEWRACVLVCSERGANLKWLLASEADDAAYLGQEPPGRYAVYRVEELGPVDDEKESIEFETAGANG